MAPRKKQITEIEKTQNGTLPSFCQAVTKRSLDVLGTLLISNLKSQIANLTFQISNDHSQISNLTSFIWNRRNHVATSGGSISGGCRALRGVT
jgi:hypothetical protein